MNGIGYSVYYEKYYYGARGQYYDYYSMMLDYGFFDCEFIEFENFMRDKDVISAYNVWVCTLEYYDRKRTFLNAYGICDGEYSEAIPTLVLSFEKYDFVKYDKMKL